MARKILFYTHAFRGGGAETVFARLADAFAASGDAVIFAADHAGSAIPSDTANLRHVVVGPGHLGAVFALRGLLARERPDVSFSALGAQNLKHLAAAQLAGRRRRCVLGYHGFAEAEPKRLSRACFQSSALVTRLAARTICVSDALLDDVRTRWRGSRTRTLRIYNPLPPAAASDAAPAPRDMPPLIVGCGRLVAGKRFPDLVAALARVDPPETRLAILGEGPDRPRIEAAIAAHRLERRVELAGFVDDPSPWYRRAACLAIASESESFGLTAAEAMMHGTPVVATDCGGVAEVLDGGGVGRLVPVGDVAALAQALTQTLAAPGSDAARRRQAETFGIDAIHRAYAELADAVAAEASASPIASAR